MSKRVVPEPQAEQPDPLTQGPKSTWAVYIPDALIAEVKRCAREDGFKSAGGYAEALLIYALRVREEERIRDRQQRK